MECHWITWKRSSYSMFGELTLWGHFHHLTEMCIYIYSCNWLFFIMGLSHCSTTNDARTFIKKFDENIFPRFGTPRAIVSDEGTHLCNKLFANMTNNFGIKKQYICHTIPIPRALLKCLTRKSSRIWRRQLALTGKTRGMKLGISSRGNWNS